MRYICIYIKSLYHCDVAMIYKEYNNMIYKMGAATSKSAANDNIVIKNYIDDNKPYKFISGYNKKVKSKNVEMEMVVNYLGDRNDNSCNSLSYY